jgi:hypothetical protein
VTHTYFVGEVGVLVHNQSPSGLTGLVGQVKGALARYPNVIDPRTGRHIPFPTNTLQKVPKSQRVKWDGQTRHDYIKEWHDRGFETPRGGWKNYDIHHIQPREFGGTIEFWNLVPVERGTHHDQFDNFWRYFLPF